MYASYIVWVKVIVNHIDTRTILFTRHGGFRMVNKPEWHFCTNNKIHMGIGKCEPLVTDTLMVFGRRS